MSELDPELRRLIRWSRAGQEDPPAPAPFGMSGRIASQWRESVDHVETVCWPRLQLATAWLSISILAAGLAFWRTELHRSASAYDFAPAYQLIARNIAP